MKSETLKDMLYGSILELMKNPKLFRVSTVSWEYSAWTDEGVKALADTIELFWPQIHKVEREELEKRAIEQTLKTLKS